MKRRSSVEAVVAALRVDLVALRERVVALETANHALREENAALREAAGHPPAEQAALEAEIAALQAALAARPRGGKNASNSSKPPSSDHPHDPKSARDPGQAKPPADRKRGGQPGHPGAQATVALLTGGAQITRRTTTRLLQELFGLPVALGTVSRVEATVSAALAAADAAIAARVNAAPVVNCDETPWREPGGKPWLWVATTPGATLFRITGHRDGAAFAMLLPPRPGQIKGTDRYAVYVHGIPVEEHAVC